MIQATLKPAIPQKPSAAGIVEEKTPLVLAIEAEPRIAWEFEAGDVLFAGRRQIGKFRMRVATTVEQDDALRGADAHVKQLIKDATGDIGEQILGNAKIAYLMQAVCVDEKHDRPAFHSGKWLREWLSPDQLGVLLNCYHECLRLSRDIDLELDDDKIEALAAILANHADTDAPNLILARYTQAQLGEIVIRLCMKLLGERAALAAGLPPDEPTPALPEAEAST